MMQDERPNKKIIILENIQLVPPHSHQSMYHLEGVQDVTIDIVEFGESASGAPSTSAQPAPAQPEFGDSASGAPSTSAQPAPAQPEFCESATGAPSISAQPAPAQPEFVESATSAPSTSAQPAFIGSMRRGSTK